MRSSWIARQVLAAHVAGLVLLVAANGAEAKGCLKGAAVGAVAGHVAGHHAVVGAAAGCVVGHHLAKKKQQEQLRQPQQQHSPQPSLPKQAQPQPRSPQQAHPMDGQQATV
jgi:hypothetical protein